MSIHIIKGKYPHIGWVDIEGKGVLTEIAIVSNKPTGLSFIKLNTLDAIDKQRLFRVISNRNSHMYELWDLMSNITLGNGANALDYFHQYVKVLTGTGEVMNPQMGRVAAPQFTGVRTIKPQTSASQQEVVTEAEAPATKTTRRRTTKKADQPAAE